MIFPLLRKLHIQEMITEFSKISNPSNRHLLGPICTVPSLNSWIWRQRKEQSMYLHYWDSQPVNQLGLGKNNPSMSLSLLQ